MSEQKQSKQVLGKQEVESSEVSRSALYYPAKNVTQLYASRLSSLCTFLGVLISISGSANGTAKLEFCVYP